VKLIYFLSSRRLSRNLIQSTAKVHARCAVGVFKYQNFVYFSVSSTVATASYCRPIEILIMLSPPQNFTIKLLGPTFFTP